MYSLYCTAETAGGDGSDDEDMFADSDDEGTKKKPSDAAAAAKTTTAPENSSASHADAAAAPTADTGQGDAVAQPVEAPATGNNTVILSLVHQRSYYDWLEFLFMIATVPVLVHV